MKTCHCGNSIPANIVVEGKRRNLRNRKYCFECSPFGTHNTKKLDTPENDRRRRNKNAEYVLAYRQRNSIKAKEYLGGKCKVCGYNKCHQALEFHHIDKAKKKYGLSNIMNRQWYFIVKELKKCILLCSNCHREVEYGLIELNIVL